MKRNFKIAAILMIIAALCGLAVSGMNVLTSQIIEENKIQAEENLCKEIFVNYDKLNSISLTEGFVSDAITKKVVVKDSSNNELGFIYTVSGKNSYGGIVLLVGIDNNGKLVSVEFLENGQSFASDVVKHVEDNYSSGLTKKDVTNIDVKCGATYGAKTVKELVTIAFNDYNGGAK